MATMLDAVIQLKDNFSSTLQQVEQNVGNFSRTSKRMGRDIQRTGKSVGAVGGTLTKALTVPLLGMGAGAVKVGMEFESSMSNVAATMGITVDEIKKGSKSFKLLEDAAQKSGRETQYSASEAAEALNYLALAGYDAEKSAEMLPKVLNLAAAGGLDLAYASDMVTDSMSALSLSTAQADTFIDEMAKTAQSSNTSVEQLGEAILTVGANGKDLRNGTLELNTAIGLLGNAGIKGAEAGTKLRNIIMAMNPTTDKAVSAFKRMKVSSYDANGNLRPLNETLVDMSKSMEGLTMKEKQDIMSGIFNKQDMAAASTLLASVTQSTEDLDYALAEMGISTKQLNLNLDDVLPVIEEMGDKQKSVDYIMKNYGATMEEAESIYSGLMGVMGDESAWDDLEGKIDNAKGTAQEMADTLMYNLKGAFTKIKSALEGVGITVYKTLKPSLDDAAKGIQNFVDKVNDLTPEQIEMIGKFVKLAIVIGPMLMLFGKMTTGVGKLVTEFGFFAGRIAKLGLMKAIFTPGVIVLGVILALAAAAILIYKNWDKIKEVFEVVKNKFLEFTEAFAPQIEWVKGVFVRFATTLWEKVQEIIQAIMPLKDSFMEVFQKLVEAIKPLMPIFMAIAGFIVGFFLVKFMWVFNTIVLKVTAVVTAIAGIIDGLLKVFGGFIDFLVGTFTGDVERATEGLKTMFGGAVDIISAAWRGFIDFFSAPVQSAVDILDTVFHEKVAAVKKAWKGIKEFFKHPIKGTVSLIKRGWDALTSVGENYKGTNNWRGGLTSVHERGGEIIDLKKGSRVYPHDKSVRMAREQGRKEGSGNGGILVTGNTFNVRKESDIDSIASALLRKIEEAEINMP